MGRFMVKDGSFCLDGKPLRILSGAIHYFRVPREYWRDRLMKLKACGFNTVETYMAWNVHMPDENTFLTDGMLDVSAFLSLAQEMGLYAIVRPGPYICSEWEFGGLPWWLLKYDCALRCMDETYVKFVDDYLTHAMDAIRGNLIDNGGNVLMLQVENEYGSYGDDTEYLTHIKEKLLSLGASQLFTSDGDTHWMLTGGTLPGVQPTVNFGSGAKQRFALLKEYDPDGPLMCAEFWNGWFDHWGEEHHSRPPKEAEECFDEILSCGASVSAYMFHGGTNFGFMNGANCPKPNEYQPTISSYDDDAPLNECGDITPKYRLFKETLKKYAAVPEGTDAPDCPKGNYGTVKLTKCADLLKNAEKLGKKYRSAAPKPMEKFNQGYGFILYSAFVKGPREELRLNIQEVRDRAHVFVDGVFKGIIYRNDEKSSVCFSVPEKGARLDILVENMGRTNYGPYLRDFKGITEGVRLGQQFVYGWDVISLPMEDVSGLEMPDAPAAFDGRPVFLMGTFDAGQEPKDTFVKLPGFKKGVIFVNGKPLSRHWEIGPQRSAYLPAPFMKKGLNTLTVLELDGYEVPEAVLSDSMSIEGKL